MYECVRMATPSLSVGTLNEGAPSLPQAKRGQGTMSTYTEQLESDPSDFVTVDG